MEHDTLPDALVGELEPLYPNQSATPSDQRYWRGVIRDLAKSTAISPASNIPMARSLHFLISHTQVAHPDSALSIATLYTLYQAHAHAADITPSAGPGQFQGHLLRWAAANGLSYEADADQRPISINGMTARSHPLGAAETLAFLEGFALGARS